ncbi:MAG TPA: hypothetical protein PLL57_12850 [Flavobacteriales bacterium]|nr:hypothetical protein [Flavobacteriales bacterium]
MSVPAVHRWNWLRWLRLALGVAFLIEGWHSGSGFAYAIGALFAMQGVLNMGCPLLGACAAPPARASATTEEVSFDEVK